MNQLRVFQFLISLHLIMSWANANDMNADSKNAPCTSEEKDSNCEHSNKIVITGLKSPYAGLEPTTQSDSLIELSTGIHIPATLTELVNGIPGVAENGQPGLFQVTSIRGVSRQRVLNFIDNVRLSNDRRAGVAASFIDPLMLDHVHIIRGPISTYYGSGAVGGVILMNFDDHEKTEISSGYQQSGQQHFEKIHWGEQNTAFTAINRQSQNTRDISGNPLNTHFQQRSFFLQQKWQLQDYLIKSWLFHSNGDDLGRSNSRYPNRIVNIADEKHTIFKTTLSHDNQWSVDIYLHNQAIVTDTLKPQNSLNSVESSSSDRGLNWQFAWDKMQQSGLFGIEYFARKNVDLHENIQDLINNTATQIQTLNNGTVNEWAIYYIYKKQFRDLRFQFGARYFIDKSSVPDSKSEQNATTAFTGLSYQLSPNTDININVGNAIRFATLAEKFFSGTTARGTIIGNPDLNAEKSLSYDLGIIWHGDTITYKLNGFRTKLKNYIDRVSVSNEQMTFLNFTNGSIEGLESEFQWQLNELWQLNSNLTMINGQHNGNNNLADIPSDRATLNVVYQNEPWRMNFKYQHRFKKSDIGPGEIPTSSTELLTASLSYQFSPQWQINFNIENIANDTYRTSNDDLSTYASGRSVGISVRWMND